MAHHCDAEHFQILSDRTFFKTSIYPLPVAYGHTDFCQYTNF